VISGRFWRRGGGCWCSDRRFAAQEGVFLKPRGAGTVSRGDRGHERTEVATRSCSTRFGSSRTPRAVGAGVPHLHGQAWRGGPVRSSCRGDRQAPAISMPRASIRTERDDLAVLAYARPTEAKSRASFSGNMPARHRRPLLPTDPEHLGGDAVGGGHRTRARKAIAVLKVTAALVTPSRPNYVRRGWGRCGGDHAGRRSRCRRPPFDVIFRTAAIWRM